MRYAWSLLILAGCATGPGPAKVTATPAPALVITPTPAALANGLVHFPGYQESLKVRNGVAANGDSLARGYNLYQQQCAPCHGKDLQGDTGPDQAHLRDLRQPTSYKYGLTDQALYRTIKFGVPGTAMGRSSLADTQVFDLVNFLHSRHKP